MRRGGLGFFTTGDTAGHGSDRWLAKRQSTLPMAVRVYARESVSVFVIGQVLHVELSGDLISPLQSWIIKQEC